nr:MAG TPA: hypothetical protein [Caudoviricetes sp.]
MSISLQKLVERYKWRIKTPMHQLQKYLIYLEDWKRWYR